MVGFSFIGYGTDFGTRDMGQKLRGNKAQDMVTRRKFNITGSCNLERHYMVDSKARLEAVGNLIGAGEYFTINRARQYGKTTTLYMIWRRLSDRYLVVPLSFEGLGDSPYASEEAFVGTFSRLMAQYITSQNQDEALASVLQDSKAKSIDEQIGRAHV